MLSMPRPDSSKPIFVFFCLKIHMVAAVVDEIILENDNKVI